MVFRSEKKYISLIYLLIFYSSLCCGQNSKILTGIVKDVLDQNPVSNAYIYSNSGSATVTDSLGGFKLSCPDQGFQYIVISHIGYQNDTILTSQVRPDQTMEVNLVYLPTHLNEVVVYDKYDPALILMRKVIESIPKNYNRDECSSYYALLRESLQLKGNDSIPLYLIENIIKDYANVNGNKLNYKVDLLNTRTFINPSYYNFSEIGLTGTAFVNEKYNPVLTLSGPLNPSHFENRYKFMIIDTLYISNNEFIKLRFKRNKDSTHQGYLIVNSKDYSISEFYISQSKEDSFLPTIDSYKRKSIDLFVTYKWSKDHYIIDKLNVSQEYFPFKGDTLMSQGQYLNLKDHYCEEYQKINIPLNKDEVLLDEIDKKKASPWKPSSRVETKEFDYLFEQGISEQEKSKRNQKKSFKSKLRLGYRVPFWIRNVNSFTINFQHPYVPLNETISTERVFDISIGAIISYKASENMLFRIGAFDSFKRNRFSSRYIEILYEKNLNQNFKSFLNFGIQFNYLKQRIFLESITGANSFNISGKAFDSGDFETYFEQRSFTISPIVSYSYKIGRSAYLEIGGFMPINIIVQDGVFFFENDSFLKRKRAFTDENLTITSENEVLISNTPNLFFGIKWQLK